MDFDAIVLAGGPARRLDGADKGAVQLAHVPLLRRALEIVAGAQTSVVVGPPTNMVTAGANALEGSVRFITEQPPRSGPAAAISAGLTETTNDLVVVLACDMPFVGTATVQRLLAATGSDDGALLVDDAGRRQYLAAAYRATALRAALDRLDPIQNAPVHKAISVLAMTEIPADPDEAFDIDTWNDVDRSRRLMEEQ